MNRLEAVQSTTDQALTINGHSLVQVRSLLSDKSDHGLTCMDGCANAGVISTWTHHITHTVSNRKANLLGAQSNFKSKGLPIGTGITALDFTPRPKQACLSPSISMKPASMMIQLPCISNCQMREFGIVVDDVATKHVKDNQGNMGTQSLHMPDGGPKLPLTIADALPVMTIRKPTKEELDTLPRHELTSEAPWNPKEHHHDFESVVLNTEISSENSENLAGDSPMSEHPDMDPTPPSPSIDHPDMHEDIDDPGEQFHDAMEEIDVTKESDDFEDPQTDHSEIEGDFHFFDPSDDISADAVKGKAVQLSIDDCSNCVRETDIHTMLLELKDEELFGLDQEFDSIACAKGLRNKVHSHLKDPHTDPSNLWTPSDPDEDDTTPCLQKDAITESLPEESKVWEPGESGAVNRDSEAPETGEPHPSQPTPANPEDTDLDIPPPLHNPEPLEQEQIRHKFARALPKVDDPATLRPKLGCISIRRIQETLKRTTQLAKRVTKFPMVRHLKSSFKWLTDQRINEKVSTDTIFANTASVDGYPCAQVYLWHEIPHVKHLWHEERS